jgi:hypothetical protein
MQELNLRQLFRHYLRYAWIIVIALFVGGGHRLVLL